MKLFIPAGRGKERCIDLDGMEDAALTVTALNIKTKKLKRARLVAPCGAEWSFTAEAK